MTALLGSIVLVGLALCWAGLALCWAGLMFGCAEMVRKARR